MEDFETVLDDLDSFWGVWRNRVLRILLVVILVNVAASIGAIWGAATIFSLLQSR